MPGSPVSRPVTTTGEPKPPAPRAAGAMTRPSASARVHRCAFMEGMHSRGEESPRSLLGDAIGEHGEKKGGDRVSYLVMALAAPDPLQCADAAAPLLQSRRSRLPPLPRGLG